MWSFGASSPARGWHRDHGVRTIENAFAKGRITELQRAALLHEVRTAYTRGDVTRALEQANGSPALAAPFAEPATPDRAPSETAPASPEPTPATGTADSWTVPQGGQPTAQSYAPPMNRRQALAKQNQLACLAIVGVLGLGVVGLIVSMTVFLSSGDSDTDTSSAVETDPGPAPAQDPELHTPDGIRTMIADLRKRTGTEITYASVYPERATLTVPVGNGKDRWYSFDSGGLAKDGRPPEAGIPGREPVDLAKLDVKEVPRLIRTAKESLKVKKVDVVYLAFESVTNLDTDLTYSAIAVHVSNRKLHSGLLYATLDGKILKREPYEATGG